MTDYQTNSDCDLTNVQKMGADLASKLLQVQDRMIHGLRAEINAGDRIIRAQEQIIQAQQKEIEELRLKLSKFEAIAQKILNFSDRN